MRLKDIKPGMVIHCKNDDEKKALYDELCRIGNIDTSDGLDSFQNFKHSYYGNYKIKDLKGRTWGFTDEHATVEFSDLVIPELTAEEAIRIIKEICNGRNCESCPIYSLGKEHESCNKICIERAEDVVKILSQWKSDHEKKEPEIEIEWIWQGRIFAVHNDRCYYQIKDDTGVYDTGCESRESAEEYMAEKLNEYCKTHDGEHIAKVERVCRVKGGAE